MAEDNASRDVLKDRAKRSEQFLSASYKTKGKKQLQLELHPDLEIEIAEDLKKRAAADKSVCSDQNSTAYKDVAEKIAGPLVGSQLSQKQRTSYLTRCI